MWSYLSKLFSKTLSTFKYEGDRRKSTCLDEMAESQNPEFDTRVVSNSCQIVKFTVMNKINLS